MSLVVWTFGSCLEGRWRKGKVLQCTGCSFYHSGEVWPILGVSFIFRCKLNWDIYIITGFCISAYFTEAKKPPILCFSEEGYAIASGSFRKGDEVMLGVWVGMVGVGGIGGCSCEYFYLFCRSVSWAADVMVGTRSVGLWWAGTMDSGFRVGHGAGKSELISSFCWSTHV